jgi:hypothetical protein
MSGSESMEVRELSGQEQRETDGGVLPGGCVDPRIQQIIDIVNGTSQP